MSIMSKIARITKPGMFSAVLVGVAITAAATYAQKLAIDYDRALQDIEQARTDLEVLETHAASAILEIQQAQAMGTTIFEELRAKVSEDVFARLRYDIMSGKYDETVLLRSEKIAADVDAER